MDGLVLCDGRTVDPDGELVAGGGQAIIRREPEQIVAGRTEAGCSRGGVRGKRHTAWAGNLAPHNGERAARWQSIVVHRALECGVCEESDGLVGSRIDCRCEVLLSVASRKTEKADGNAFLVQFVVCDPYRGESRHAIGGLVLVRTAAHIPDWNQDVPRVKAIQGLANVFAVGNTWFGAYPITHGNLMV